MLSATPVPIPAWRDLDSTVVGPFWAAAAAEDDCAIVCGLWAPVANKTESEKYPCDYAEDCCLEMRTTWRRADPSPDWRTGGESAAVAMRHNRRTSLPHAESLAAATDAARHPSKDWLAPSTGQDRVPSLWTARCSAAAAAERCICGGAAPPSGRAAPPPPSGRASDAAV